MHVYLPNIHHPTNDLGTSKFVLVSGSHFSVLMKSVQNNLYTYTYNLSISLVQISKHSGSGNINPGFWQGTQK